MTTERTPFNGGSGLLPEQPELANRVRNIGVATLVVTALIGGYFLLRHGMGLLLPGLLGLILVAAYTPMINRMPKLCLIAPGTGFGLVMVMGTDFVLTGEYHFLAFIVSIVPFFLVNNLLLLNQYPDLEADKAVGRATFPVVYGTKRASVVYAVFIFGALYSIGIGVAISALPMLSLLAMLPLLAMIYAVVGGFKYGTKIGGYPRYLQANVLATLSTIAFLALSILIE